MTKVTVEIEDVIGQFQSLGDEIKRLRDALRECVESYEQHIRSIYPVNLPTDAALRSFNDDMEPIRKARTALEEKE